MLARDTPGAMFHPEMFDMKFANSGGQSIEVSHQPSGIPLNKKGYAQGMRFEDLRTFSRAMDSAYALCEVVLGDTPPVGCGSQGVQGVQGSVFRSPPRRESPPLPSVIRYPCYPHLLFVSTPASRKATRPKK